MRPSCLNCCRKHLAQAEVLMLEVYKGYVAHSWLAIGHLAEAEDEMLEDYPHITDKIREERLKYIESLNNYFDEEYMNKIYKIDTLSLLEEVTDIMIHEVKDEINKSKRATKSK